MLRVNKSSLKKKISNFFLITTFIVFLIPYSISGLSANYSYILYPLLIILINWKIKPLNKNFILIISYFFLILFLSIMYQFELMPFLDRRLISFLIFMTIFSYMIIDIDEDKIKAFKIAIVLIILFFCFWKLERYISYNYVELKSNLKFYLGSSRYGFVYILAFWISWFYQPHSKLFNILKFSNILLILIGIVLTYSRTTLLAFFVSFFFYYLSNFSLKKKRFFKRFLFIIFIPIIILTVINFLHIIAPWTAKYFSNTIFIYFSIDGLTTFYQDLFRSGSSHGFRFTILEKIVNYAFNNPFTGSGFLGCWIMFDNLKCSAHNQYGDVLFRTGFIGLYFYLFILYKVFEYLRNNHKDLFYGFIGVLVYGFFHETFKLSQGAFILTFLLGAMASAKRKVGSKFYKNSEKFFKKIEQS